jgi:hypothetical protein
MTLLLLLPRRLQMRRTPLRFRLRPRKLLPLTRLLPRRKPQPRLLLLRMLALSRL